MIEEIKLSIQPKTLWAKKRLVDGRGEWLPLIAHLVDTMNISRMLFNQWLSPEQRELLEAGSDQEEALKLIEFIGFVHDFGKATPAFQLKQSYDHSMTLDSELIEKLIWAGFKDLDLTSLASANKSPHAKAGEALLERFGVPESVGAIIGGHHGRPLSQPPYDDIKHFTSNYWQSDHDLQLQVNWQAVQKEILDYALDMVGYHSIEEIPEVAQPQAIILEGLLIMADWLASSEYLNDDPTQPLFPLISLEESLDDIDLEARYQAAWQRWQQSDEWLVDRVELQPDPYKKRWGFNARPVQRVVTQALDQNIDPGIVIIEAPMGMGKTELALLAAEQLAYKEKATGLFFGLPTQATANAMFNRVEDWVQGLARQADANYDIRLMHSKAEFNQQYQAIPVANQVGDDPRVVINQWFGGKKSILDEFSIGTIDNLLQMDLKQKHLALKHLGLSKKVVIIDEVHAYDAFMNQHLFRSLEWLGAYHVPVVVLSATLPVVKRNQLLASYFHGKYGKSLKKGADLSQVSSGWEDNQAYPLVSILDGQKLQQITTFPGKSDQSALAIQIEKMSSAEDELVTEVLETIKDGGVAGIIVNTITRAQRVAALFADQVQVMVLHSAFVAAQRTELESQLQALIGKNAKRPERLVVIGTQVLEQSLDIDFDVLFSDIAPMDLLLQRAGRLHRHSIQRPDKLRSPRLHVTGIEGENQYEAGSVAVYGQYLLMKTEALMPSTIKLPEDISRLVQKVYNLNHDPDIEGIQAAKTEFEKHIAIEEQKARAFQIAKPKYKGQQTLHGWLDNDMPGVDVNEIKAEAAVRDIQESVEVIILRRSGKDDYLLDGRQVNQENLNQYAKLIAQQTIRLPRVFSFKIDATIKALEKETATLYPQWQQNTWLRGALALPLDDDFNAELTGYGLHYSQQVGLSWWKEDIDG